MVPLPGVEAPGPGRTRGLSYFFGAVFAANLVLLFVYQFVVCRHEVNSDSAVKVLLANEILQTGELFPKDWVYANGDLYAFFSHTLALPLIPLFGPGFVTHAIVGTLISLGLLLATWLVLRELWTPTWQRLAIMALIGSGISSLLAENLFGQATYGFIIMLNVAIVAIALRFSRQFETRPSIDWRSLAALASLSLLVSWNNPKRALVMLAAPFLSSCLAVLTARFPSTPSMARLKRAPEMWVALAHVVGFSLGALAYFVVVERPINNVDPAAMATWLGTDAIWRNAVHALLGVLAQLGGVPIAGGPVVSGWGLYEALRLVLAMVLLWGVVRATRHLLPSTTVPLRFVAVFTLVGGALSLMFFAFTTVPDTLNPVMSARYLVPALFTGLLLLPGLSPERPVRAHSTGLVIVGTIALVSVCGATTLSIPGYGSTGRTWFEARQRGMRRQALISFLKEQGLKFGYATYWNAGALTLLSDGAVTIRQIQLETLPVPMHLHGSNRWFRPAEWQGETFLLLSQAELKRIDRTLLEAQLGGATRTLSFGDFKVLVFGKNLSNLQGWSDLVEAAQTFDVTPRSPHVIGRYQPQDAFHGTLSSAVGESGELLFGPYMWLAPGKYRVSFDVAAEGQSPVGTLQVTARRSTVEVVTQPLQPGPRSARVLEFELAQEEKFVEFRVLANGTGALTLHNVKLERAR